MDLLVLSATLFTSSPVKGFCTQRKKSLALIRSVMMDLISIRWISEVTNVFLFYVRFSKMNLTQRTSRLRIWESLKEFGSNRVHLGKAHLF